MLWNKKVEEEDALPDLPFQARKINSSTDSQVIEGPESNEEHFESIKTSENQSLPSFPDSPMNKGFSQSAIKEAISTAEDEKIPLPPSNNEEIPLLPKPQKAQNTFIQPNPFLNESVNIEEEKVEPPAVTKFKSENKIVKTVEIPHEYPKDAPRPPTSMKPQTPRIPKMIQPVPLKIAPEEPIQKEPVKIYQKPEEKTTDVFVKIDKFYSAKKALSIIKRDVKEIENILNKIRETKIREEREIATWEKNISSVKEEIEKMNESLFSKST